MRNFIVVGIVLFTTAFACGGDWPGYLGPQHNGASAETGLLRAWAKDGPKKLWEKNVGSGWSGVAAAGNQLILFHRIGDEEIVECLVASSGKTIWKQSLPTGYVDDFNFDDGPRGTPAISGGLVYVLGAEGRLACLKLADGSKVWEQKLAEAYPFRKGYFGVGTSPLVVDGRLFVNVGGKGAGVVAFDAKSGNELWKATDHKAGYSSPTVATLDGKKRIVFLTRDGLLVLDPENGKVIHDRPFRARIDASVNAATPLVQGNQVFVTSSYNTGALLLEAGAGGFKEIWKNDESLSCHYNTPVPAEKHLFGIHGRQEYGADLRCVEWATGNVVWEKKRFGCAGLIAVDGLIVAAVETGEIVLLEANAKEYRELGRVQALGEKMRAAPALSDGRLFIRDTKKLAAFAVK